MWKNMKWNQEDKIDSLSLQIKDLEKHEANIKRAMEEKKSAICLLKKDNAFAEVRVIEDKALVSLMQTLQDVVEKRTGLQLTLFNLY
jgi:hypothetical protein